MLIKDVVTKNTQAAFANDVQLSWYPNDPRNLPLVRGYMFTSKALENKIPSVKMLKNLRDSFLYDDDNRHVIIATFGHGKSHLALALANFFGKPAESEEVGALLDNIAHVADPSEAQNLREFKDDRPPFLIIRLRGDQPQNLHQQFVHGLEIALSEHPGTKHIALPFWFDKAEAFLKGLSGDNLNKANMFLAKHDADIATLISRVSHSNRDQTAYDLCVMVFTHVIGTPPNFGGEVSLDDMIQWASDTFCKDSNPVAGGILILFDEFSAFIRRYAARTVKADTPLQDLLNGVANRQRKVVFAAFSQRDPIADAKDIYQQGGDKYDSLLKEIERLPNQRWHSLYSSLETVLNAYLKQTDAIAEITENASNSFISANNATMQLLKPRYDDSMSWGYEQVDQIMARGCFPLHPLTTGLFCSIEFKQVTNTRSVLGFVHHELEQRLDQPALIGGKPNWVYPIALVDWFKEMLAEREYKEYEAASANAGPEIPEVQKAVLKSILLFGIGRLQLGKVGISFGKAASQLCGYPAEECEQALETLRSAGYVRFDPTRKVYTFWPANAGANKIEEMVRKELQGKTIESAHINFINGKDSPWVAPIEVAGVDWGHPQEWAAKEVLLPRYYFSATYIKRLAPYYQLDAKNGLSDGVRGCVIRLIAATDEDVTFFREKATQVLQEALGSDPLPIVLCLPTDPTAQLCNNLLAYYLLKDWPNDKREEVSQEAYNDKRKRLEKDIKDDLLRLRGLAELIVPEDYRNDVLAEDAQRKVENALRVCYQRAYRYSPKHYFTGFSGSATTHRNAVALICQYLAYNTLSGAQDAIAQNKVADALIMKYLRQNGATGWGLLTMTNYLTEPTNTYIKRGWDFLNTSFPHGAASIPVKEALIALLNPPFGYDPHQVALLFFAWYGFYKRDLTMATTSGKVTVEDYLQYLKPAREFLNRICYVDPPLLTRTDPDIIEREIRQIVERVKKETFTIADAEQTHKTLRDYAKNDSIHPDLKKHIESAVSQLEADVTKAKKYKEEFLSITSSINAEVALGKFLPLISRIGNLPTLGRVAEQWPSPSSLTSQLNTKIETATEKECLRLEKLKSLGDFALNKKMLDELRGVIVRRIKLVSRVDEAMKSLQAAKTQLEGKQRDLAIAAEVNAMQADTSLTILNSNQEKLTGYRPQSDEVKELVEAKKAMLQNAAESALAFVNGISERLDNLSIAQNAHMLQNEIQRNHNLFKGSPYQEKLVTASDRCAHIQDCLTKLEFLQTGTIQTPSDVQDLSSRLFVLLESQQEFLSNSQKTLFENTKQTWDGKVAASQQEATQWLTEKQALADQSKDLDSVNLALSKPPAFLTDEDQLSLIALRKLLDQKLQKENAKRKLRDQDLPISAEVKGMQVTESLNALRTNLGRLTELTPKLPETVDLIKEKSTQLMGAIDTFILRLSQLSAKAEQSLDAKAARQLDQEIQRIYTRYQDAPEQTTLEKLSARCKSLEDFCEKRSQIEQRSFDDPEAAQKVLDELSGLEATHAEFLNGPQRTLISESHQRIEKRIKEKSAQAAKWLADKEQLAVTTGNLEGLLSQLKTPPAFLADDLQGKLTKIRTAAQKRITEIQKEQARKDQDAPIVVTVKAMPDKGPLTMLRGYLQQLGAFKPQLPETKSLVSAKCEVVSKAIQNLEADLPRLVAQLKDTVTPRQAEDLKNSLLRIQNLYADTPEETEIGNIAASCDRLVQCLRECDEIGQAQPDNPESFADLLNRLVTIETKLGTNLSPKQTAIFDANRKRIVSYAESKEKAAALWLESCGKQAEQMTDPVKLLATLASPPTFLPATFVTNVEDLRHQAHLKIDEDVVTRVIGEFKQISDKAKRMMCLNALQALIQEMDD